MESVVFENMAAVKTFKKEKRQEMLVLMMKFPEWYKHPDTPIGKTIVQLGKLIDGETMDVSRPIQTINKETFTKEDYVKLKQLGYSEKAIRRAVKISGNSWWSFRANLLANGMEDCHKLDTKRADIHNRSRNRHFRQMHNFH